MKLSPSQVREAVDLESKGVQLWALAQMFSVHYDTMRRYLRNYRTYGDSMFTPYPKEIEE